MQGDTTEAAPPLCSCGSSSMEIAIHVIIMIMGGFWVQQGLSVYGFWKNNIPGSGFLPVIFGLIVLCLTMVSLIRVLKQRHSTRIVALGESILDATTGNNRMTFKSLIARPQLRPLDSLCLHPVGNTADGDSRSGACDVFHSFHLVVLV